MSLCSLMKLFKCTQPPQERVPNFNRMRLCSRLAVWQANARSTNGSLALSYHSPRLVTLGMSSLLAAEARSAAARNHLTRSHNFIVTLPLH
jgi:hypothetical protein